MPHRRRNSLRLKGYDYTRPGGYFVTIKTLLNQDALGTLIDGTVILSMPGQIAEALWFEIPSHFSHVRLDNFAILPDHIHGILILGKHLVDNDNTNVVLGTGVTTGSISAIIRSYKSAVTASVNKYLQTPGNKFWQRNYYDRIIRDEKSLHRIRQYIENNAMLHWRKYIENQT
jgi:putative transposase